MRIVVFSDSHGNYYALKNIVRAQKSADIFIHLGDGIRDFDTLVQAVPDREMYNVRGNCDWTSQIPTQGLLECRGRKIFYTHGHTFHVKAGLSELRAHGRAIGANIVLFGHTHHVYTEYDDGLYLMNPGSVHAPATGSPSYGVIDITEAGIAMNIVRV